MRNFGVLVLVLIMITNELIQGYEFSRGPKCQSNAERICRRKRSPAKYVRCCKKNMELCLSMIAVRAADETQCYKRLTKFTFCYTNGVCADIYMEETVCIAV
uniref:Cnidarian restricted protein n=1 Tax=Clytia hemisphaerica TaxID=252671 RepID=A0A7M5VCX5_9CNID